MAVFLNPLVSSHLKIPDDGNYPELEYFRCQLKDPTTQDKFVLLPRTTVPKARIHFRIKGEEGWRVGEEPHQIRGLFPIMALANVVIFAGTLVLRTAQVAIILMGVFFRAHMATYRECESPEFTDRFFAALEKEISVQKTDLYEMGVNLVRDGKCFAAMEVAAGLGIFTTDGRKIVQMQMVWGKMEFEWNQERSYAKTSVAKVFRWFKHQDVSQMTFAERMEKITEIVGDSNGAFYLWECAQVRRKGLSERLNPIGEGYQSYRAVAKAIEEQADRYQQQHV